MAVLPSADSATESVPARRAPLAPLPTSFALLGPHPAAAGEHPRRPGMRVVKGPAHDGGVAVGRQCDGVALLGGYAVRRHPTSLLPCWVHTPPLRVNTHAAPARELSPGPPTTAVLPSADSANQVVKRSKEMTASARLPLAPVGQQAPPAHAATRLISITELNDAIRDCVTTLNQRVTRHLGASRRMLFDDVDRPMLKPLPVEPYVYAEWKQCRVGVDYHVEVDKHFYSVPHTLLRETIWARITARTVEVFHHGQRVAAHVRSSSNRKHTTVREHMPSSHQRYADWTLERITRQAGEIGPKTSALVEVILRERTHPEQGFRACVGIMRLVKSYGAEGFD